MFAPPFPVDSKISEATRRRGLRRILDWLADEPGGTWQDRWLASGADTAGNTAWRTLAVEWTRAKGIGFAEESYLHLGGSLRTLICGDVIRPSLSWLTGPATVRWLASDMARLRDPSGFAELDALIEAGAHGSAASTERFTRMEVLSRIATVMAAKGGGVRDITAGDCLELLTFISEKVNGRLRRNSLNFYQLLHTLGVFPLYVSATVR
ncbi:MAG: site-specific integrase, partial [Actinophytocola sp.]|nr:site-specific integrase [Actinophytocola sp.]